MPQQDKRSFNNADLDSPTIASLKKKSKRVAQIQLRVGSKKILVPAEGHLLLTESGYGFVSVQPVNAVIQSKDDSSFEVIAPKDTAQAVASLKAYRAKKGISHSRRSAPELSEELSKMLEKVPKGYKLVAKSEGYVLVKSRLRKAK